MFASFIALSIKRICNQKIQNPTLPLIKFIYKVYLFLLFSLLAKELQYVSYPH